MTVLMPSRMVNGIFLLCALYIITVGAVFTDPSKQPPKIDPELARPVVTVPRRETARLVCPVLHRDRDEKLFTFWFYQSPSEPHEEAIDSLWSRHTERSNTLIISEVDVDDQGTYICRASNGFGSLNFSITLKVQGDAENGGTGSLSTSEPSIIGFEPFKKTEVKIGDSVRIRCRASGRPTPTFIWYKDGQRLSNTDAIEQGKRKSVLNLKNAVLEDAGTYKCEVNNEVGNDYREVEIVVRSSPPWSSPGLPTENMVTIPHPVNMTVHFGAPTSFLCKVKSQDKPTIYWLRKIDESERSKWPANSTFPYLERWFAVLESDEPLQNVDGVYINKLHIREATEADSGLYACAGANSQGFNYQYIHLRVLPQRDASSTPAPKKSILSVPVIIAVPCVIVAGLLIALGIYMLVTRRMKSANGAGWSRPGNPPLHGSRNGYVPTTQGYGQTSAGAPLVAGVMQHQLTPSNYSQTQVALSGRRGLSPPVQTSALPPQALSHMHLQTQGTPCNGCYPASTDHHAAKGYFGLPGGAITASDHHTPSSLYTPSHHTANSHSQPSQYNPYVAHR